VSTTPQTARAHDQIEPDAGSMHAVVQDRYGSADVLHHATVSRPTAGEDDVLIRVRAAGLQLGDWHLMTGQPYLMRVMGFGLRAPKARVRGTDVAGTVVAVGAHVGAVQIGDEVFGTCDGAYAEYATARPGTLAPKPNNLSFEEAAAVPTSAVTALTAVRDAGHVTAGQRVLVIGAGGGVGLFAVQIAKALGAEVTGLCSTTKVALVRSVGADHVIDYTKSDVGSNGLQYDVIIDMGGNRPLSQLRRSLTPRGTLVLVGGEGGGRWIGSAMGRSLRAMLLSPFVTQKLRMIFATA
jgi:NADPH:quinone reductase-like Zn-dependent oxidoreductase